MANNQDMENLEVSEAVTPPEPEKQSPTIDSKGSEATHRYVCEACSGVAFYGTEGADYNGYPSVCHNCGSDIPGIKPENFIALTEDEKASLRSL